MPTRQTNLTLVQDATADALAAARPNASIAALDDASSAKDAAGPAAASPRSVLGLLKRYWRAFQDQRQRQRLRATLHELSDWQLRDIGVRRDEIGYIAPHRAIDTLRDGTTHLGM